MYAVSPFNNTVDRIIIKGKNLRNVLEERLKYGKHILQLSGARLEYTEKSREMYLTRFQVKCHHNSNHQWCNLKDDKNYTIRYSFKFNTEITTLI